MCKCPLLIDGDFHTELLPKSRFRYSESTINKRKLLSYNFTLIVQSTEEMKEEKQMPEKKQQQKTTATTTTDIRHAEQVYFSIKPTVYKFVCHFTKPTGSGKIVTRITARNEISFLTR